MKTLEIGTTIKAVNYTPLIIIILVLVSCILVQLLPHWLQSENSTFGILDPSIWQLWLFAMLGFLLITISCWFAMQWFWVKLGLPTIHTMVLQFKNLTLWQQFVGYWASFALLFLGALLSLAAVF